MLTAVGVTRHQLLHDGMRLWAYAVLMVTTLLALWFSFMWFRDPMHDIGLFFGSHGRWGCATIHADGSRVHLIRDDTVPWLLFAPLLIAEAAHDILKQRRRAQNQSVDGTR
jgi:hypothetical protein